MENFIREIMQNRYSCRNFNDKKIDDKTLREIIDLTRLSPSSVGLEPWKFMVVSGENLTSLATICNAQKHIEKCSHAVIIISRNDIRPDDKFLRERIESKGKSKEKVEKYIAFVGSKTGRMSERELCVYTDLQGYLACANLVNIACAFGVQSCIIGGFDYNALSEFIAADGFGAPFHPCVVVALGYSDDEPAKKIRQNLDEVLVYKK